MQIAFFLLYNPVSGSDSASFSNIFARSIYFVISVTLLIRILPSSVSAMLPADFTHMIFFSFPVMRNSSSYSFLQHNCCMIFCFTISRSSGYTRFIILFPVASVSSSSVYPNFSSNLSFMLQMG